MKLAEENSEAPSKANAGLIGPLNLGDLSPDLRKVIEASKPGDVTMPIRTTRGYQFFKIETLTTAETLLFEAAREQINDKVFAGKRKEEFDKYLAKLRTQAIIDWKNADVKKAYEEGLATPAKAAAQ
jgi:parvulin-like peptidyl-prolyl isomerase